MSPDEKIFRPLSTEEVLEFGLLCVREVTEESRGEGGFRNIDWSKEDKDSTGGFVSERGRWLPADVCGRRDERMKTGKTSGGPRGLTTGNREARRP